MNRVIRRQKNRELGRKRFLTEQEIIDIKLDAVRYALGLNYIITLATLKDYGWGKVRLQRFYDDLKKKSDEFESDNFDLNDVVNNLKINYKIKL